MIFGIPGHIEKIIAGKKTQTRRPSDRYGVGRVYAVQPGRGRHGIPDGKIHIVAKIREWKPDLDDLPRAAIFARQWRQAEAGYPIWKLYAQAEGGYTPEEFEELYEEMYPGWTERYAYSFFFVTADELREASP
jgi:hypothetical protein